MLSPDQVNRLRKALAEERDRLQRGLENLDPSEVITDEEIVGNHPAEDASEVFNQEANLSLRQNQQRTLDEVIHALQRMDRGTYGVCERCGMAIDFARLKASPAARFCMKDQRLFESEI